MNNGEIINSVNCGGDFTLNSGEIQSLTLTTGGSGVMNGGIIHSSAGQGFGVELQVKTAFTLHNGEISGHRSIGIIVRADSSLVMDGGVIRRNGLGVAVNSGGTFTLSGGEITLNDTTLIGDAPEDGGGVSTSGNFTMSGGTISNNTGDMGGGIHLSSGGSGVISGGLISGNRAVWGGGIWAANSASCTISGGTITGNTAPFGSAVCGPLTLSGSPNIDPSNSIFLDYQGRTSNGSALHYLTIAGDISGSGTIAAIDLTEQASWWYSDGIIRHGDEYSGSLYHTRFSLGDWIHAEYNPYENRYDYTKTPIQGAIMADGRGSWCASADISAFSINGVPASILGTAIRINLPFGTGVSSLAPLVTYTPGFTLSPASGTAQDFSRPVTYTLASSSGAVKTYTVTVLVPGQLPQGIVLIDHFSAESNDMVPAVNGSTVSLTDGGFTRFQWYVDNAPRGTGNSIDLLGYPPGSHTVSLIAWKNGVPYSAETTFTVQ
jgi:hypothetical protein